MGRHLPIGLALALGCLVASCEVTLPKPTSADRLEVWEQQDSGVTDQLTAVQALDENTAFAVGFNGAFTKTADGGKTWRATPVTNMRGNAINSVWFTDPQQGWITSTEAVYRTTDGGANWQLLLDREDARKLAPNRLHSFKQLIFANPQDGWLLTEEALFRTTDGGQTWKLDPTPAGLQKPQGLERSGSNVWLSGGRLSQGIARYTPELGWVLLSDFAGLLSFPTPTHGWAFSKGGAMRRTTDGGKTWSALATKAPDGSRLTFNDNMPQLGFVDESRGWVLVDYVLLASTYDGGLTWYKQKPLRAADDGSGDSRSFLATGLDAVSDRSGWIVGSHGAIFHFSGQYQ